MRKEGLTSFMLNVGSPIRGWREVKQIGSVLWIVA